MDENHSGAGASRERASNDALAHALAEAGPDAVVVADADGRIAYVNQRCEELLGFSRAELVGEPVEALLPTALRDAHRAHRAEFAGAPKARSMGSALTLTALRRDGTELTVEVALSPLRLGGALFVAASLRDASERRRAADALRLAEERARELIEQAPDAVFVADLDGRYTDVNGAACRLLGYTREELVGKSILDILPKEQAARLDESKEFLLAARERVAVAEWTLLRKDGARIPVEVSAKIHGDGRWVAFVRDVSERKQNEETLRQNEEALARAQALAHLGSWEWDLRTNEVRRSRELYAIFGVEPGTIPAGAWSMTPYVHPDDRERLTRAIEDAVGAQRPFGLEIRVVRPDGTERIVLQQGEPNVENGKAVRFVGTVLDVTERRRAEMEREAALRWFRAVFEHVPVGLVLLHAAGDRVESNAHAKAILGHADRRSQTRIVLRHGRRARSVRATSPASARSAASLRVDRVPAAGTPRGRSSRMLVGAAPIRDAGGEVEGAVVAFQDITAAKELERLRAEWSSVVAHDLRQPLNAIMLTATYLLRANRSDAEVRASLAQIETAGKRLDRMIGDLMDLSRLEVRRLELARAPTRLPPLVRASISRLELEYPAHKIEMQVRGDVPEASADPDRVAQIVDNLLGNAAKYGDPRSPIVVVLEASKREVTMSVTNAGKGIPAEEIPRLFQRFQRTGDARASRVKGIGLGLYITRELVEAHGGRIHVTSTPGETTTFTFTLPVA